MSRAFQFQDRRFWRREEEGNAAERRRESRRHKDSYRPGNVEEEREEACSFSLFSLSLSFLAPSRALGRVGVPFQDLRRFNRAINLTPCCNNTSHRSGGGEVKISSAQEGRNRARFDLSWSVSQGQWRIARLNHVLKGSNEHAAAGKGGEGQRAREEITAVSRRARGNHKRREGPRIVGLR